MRRVYKNVCPATISASIVAANMWKNRLKNVESDNNKILYETLLDFFYSETVLTFWISLIMQYVTILYYVVSSSDTVSNLTMAIRAETCSSDISMYSII